jgi:hypothetical protein
MREQSGTSPVLIGDSVVNARDASAHPFFSIG